MAAFLDPQEITLPSGGRLEIHAAKRAGHQKFVLADFRDQRAADGFGISCASRRSEDTRRS